jgi:SAM-dependent methyltransferase
MLCRVCGNINGNTPYLVREMNFGTREQFDYFQCAGCGCLQIARFPEDMSKYYPNDYISMGFDENKFSGVKGYFRDLPCRSLLFPDSLFRKIVSSCILPHKNLASIRELGINRETRLLDVGCGKGKSFLYPLKRMGFKNIAGCDPYISQDIHYTNGLSIYKKQIVEMSENDGWDVITLHHSFEHIHNPLDTMKAVYRLLRPGGLCLIRIPTASSFAWEHYGINRVQLDAPRHLFLHSVGSIRQLADNAGLQLVKITYDSNHFQFSASENYVRGIPLKDQKKGRGLGRIGWLLRRYILNRRAHRLNQEGRGDQAAFLLKKLSCPRI